MQAFLCHGGVEGSVSFDFFPVKEWQKSTEGCLMFWFNVESVLFIVLGCPNLCCYFSLQNRSFFVDFRHLFLNLTLLINLLSSFHNGLYITEINLVVYCIGRSSFSAFGFSYKKDTGRILAISFEIQNELEVLSCTSCCLNSLDVYCIISQHHTSLWTLSFGSLY